MALLTRRFLFPPFSERSSRRSQNVLLSKTPARKTRLGSLCTAASSSSDAFHEKLPISIFGSDNASRDGLEVENDMDGSAMAEKGEAAEEAFLDSGKVCSSLQLRNHLFFFQWNRCWVSEKVLP